jgi:hypothetical protein
VFVFVHTDGRRIIANRRDFTKETGVDIKGLFRTPPNRNKMVKGWSLDN